MKTTVETNNLTKKRISPEYVQKIVRKTLKLSKAKTDIFELSVIFAGKAEIRRLNRIYRKKDKSTDVLSFRLDLGYNKSGIKSGQNYIGGEIVLCPEVIAGNARENKVKFERELTFVLAHGVLHLLGMRHGRKMFELQDKVSTNY
jgi:probable rRNA maturation factor